MASRVIETIGGLNFTGVLLSRNLHSAVELSTDQQGSPRVLQTKTN